MPRASLVFAYPGNYGVEATAEGASLTLALLAAYAGALMAGSKGLGLPPGESMADPPGRFH